MKKIVFVGMFCLSLTAHAEWTPWMTQEDGDWYVDMATRTSHPQPRVWALFDHRTPVGAFGVRSVKTQFESDCQEGSLREKYLVVFNGPMASGSVLRNTAPGTQKIFPTPDSAQEKLMHWLCNKDGMQ